jgi:hypothetical protein
LEIPAVIGPGTATGTLQERAQERQRIEEATKGAFEEGDTLLERMINGVRKTLDAINKENVEREMRRIEGRVERGELDPSILESENFRRLRERAAQFGAEQTSTQIEINVHGVIDPELVATLVHDTFNQEFSQGKGNLTNAETA